MSISNTRDLFAAPVIAVLATSVCVSAQTTWYIDDDAPGDPGPGDPLISDPLEDGTSAHPFDAIEEGIIAAADGDTVMVLDGTYTGVGNRNLDLTDRPITVRSENGASACTIDCEHLGRAFVFNYPGDASGTTIEGFTIINGSAWGALYTTASGNPTVADCVFSANEGGALVARGQGVMVIGCAFADNTAGDGGAVYIDCNTTAEFTECTFTGNTAANGGAVFNEFFAVEATFSSCVFDDNSATNGGAIFNGREMTLINCAFTANSASSRGGAFYNGYLVGGVSPEFTGCTFSYNTAGDSGGAVYNHLQGIIAMQECSFTGNSAEIFGGAIRSHDGGSLVLTGCDFLRNDGWGGGAIYCHTGGEQILTNCAFRGNVGSPYGGGAWFLGCYPKITNSVFCGNTATSHGGGLLLESLDSSDVVNCTFSANQAPTGRGLYLLFGGLEAANSICWDDEMLLYGSAAVTYSDVQGGYAGDGNIDADPLFVQAPDPGADEEWGTEDDDYGDLRLQAGSPCIDAANNDAVPEEVATDLDGNPRFVDDPDTDDTGLGDPPIVDMGSYEFQVSDCPADLNGDGVVDVIDLLAILGAWGPCPECPEDLNDDGVVDVIDLLEVLGAWGPCS